MNINNETLEAIKEELNLFRLAAKNSPEMPISRAKDCGCTGPLSECACIKRERLVAEFLNT